jgi:hypothetical protein
LRNLNHQIKKVARIARAIRGMATPIPIFEPVERPEEAVPVPVLLGLDPVFVVVEPVLVVGLGAGVCPAGSPIISVITALLKSVNVEVKPAAVEGRVSVTNAVEEATVCAIPTMTVAIPSGPASSVTVYAALPQGNVVYVVS